MLPDQGLMLHQIVSYQGVVSASDSRIDRKT